MADYAGALAAIRSRLEANWTATPITFQNENQDPPSGDAWINLEVVGTGSGIMTTGKAGDRAWAYDGLIHAHVFVPFGWGAAPAFEHAVALGEIFRAAKFYDETAGHCVRTLSPMVDGGGSGDDDGNWFRVTMSIEFTYWHRG